MRLRLRAVALFALIFAGITCSEPATGPRSSASGDSARISFVPKFTPAAVAAYRTLAAAAIEIAEIHIVLTGPDGSTRDTVIAFPVGQDTAHIEIDVPPGSNGQPFTALIELRSADHTVLFSGTQIVIARPSGLPPLSPPAVLINYSGPGRSTRTVTVGPPDTTVIGTPTIAYRATGVDSSGAATANLLVAFTSSDPTIATVTGTGNATANVVALGRRGTTTITASTPLGITGISRLTVAPVAARLVVVSGGSQTALAGSTLPQPFVVEAQAADNLPVPGAAIAFRAVTAGGSVSQTTPRIADAGGRASVTMTLGNTAGSYQYEAASGALTPVTVNQTATQPAAAAIAIVSGNAQTDSTARTLPLPLVVRVTDAFGAPVSGTTVTWARVSGSGSVSSASTTTAADGTTSTTYTLGPAIGSDIISATVPSIVGPAGSVQFTTTTIARRAGLITITAGGGQSGAPGSTLASQVTARVTDINGIPLANQVVTWTTSANAATFNPPSVPTDVAGLASTSVTLGNTVGAFTITATSGAVTTTTSATVIVGAAASLQKSAGDNQSATVGTAVSVAPKVTVTDAAGNPVSGVSVVFAVTGGGGSATGTTVTTNAAGVATVGSWILGSVAGANSLTATAGSLSTVFAATGVSGSGSVMAFVATPSATASSGAPFSTQPVLQLKDALGNNVLTAGVVVTASITSGTGSLTGGTATSTASGSVTFSGLTITGAPGNFTLSFASPGYAPLSSGTIAVSAGAAATIALNAGNGQSATVGSAVAVPPSVRVTDAGGNPVQGVVVTFGVITPGATISDGTTSGTTLNVTTNASGVAALASWTLGATAQAYTLHATATGLSGSPVVFTATGVPGSGAMMTFSSAPATTALSGQALGNQPILQLKDANGNQVTTAGVVVTASIGSGSGSLTGATATSASGGTVTFSGLTITGTPGSFTLVFSSPGYTALTSGPIAVSAGAAATIALNAGNGQSATVGSAVAVPPSVLVTDAGGNPVPGASVTFGVITPGATISDGVSSGTTLSVTTNASGIAALASWTLGATAQAYTLHATATGLSGSPVVFTANAVPGTGSTLAFTTATATTATNDVALTPQPVVQLKDANGNNVTTAGVVITASVPGARTLLNPTAITTATGSATFSGLTVRGATGTFNLSFSAPGYTTLTSAPMTLGVGSAASIAVAGGNNQSAVAGSAVPVAPSVVVTDISNNPVAGTVITFSVVTPGSVVANASTSGTSVTVATNASGVASLASWTLGNTAQQYTMTAAATGLTGSPVTFAATATPASGSVLAFAVTPPGTATSGVALAAQPAVQLRDSFGNGVATPGVVVTASITGGAGTLANPSATTDAAGVATFAGLTITGSAGNFALQFTAPGYSALPFSPIAVSAGSAVNLAMSAGNGQTTATSTAVPVAPAVLVTDGSGNPVAGTAVTFSIVTPGATVANNSTSGTSVTVPTAANGIATLTAWTLGAVAQPYTMTASVAGLTGSPVTFSATATAGAAATIALNAGNGQSATVGTAVAVPPSVRVSDAGNNPVAGVVVTFTSTTAGATIANASTTGTSLTVTTDAAGIAALTSWTLGNTAQSYALTASAGSLSGSPVGFTATATAGSGSALTFNPAPSFSATSGVPLAQQPGLQLRDSFNNPIATPGVVVTAAITSGSGSLTNATATSNAAGLATFSGLTITGTAGGFNVQFSAPGYTPTTFGPITLSAGTSATLALSAGDGQTTAAGSPVPVAPAVRVTDAAGNPVAGTVVTFSVVTPGSVVANSSTSGNTVTVPAAANGIATLTSWTLGAVAQPYTMTASVTGLSGSPVTFTGTATAGAAATIALNAGNGQSATVGTAVAVPPSVRVSDAGNNPVAGVVVTFTSTTAGATIANSSTTGTSLTVTTDAAGIAALASWTLGTTAQAYALAASAGSLSGSPVGFTATATAGSGSALVFNPSPSPGTSSGVPIAQQPGVQLRDAFNNPVRTSGVVVTAAITSGNGSLTNATATTNAFGTAQFNNLTITGTAGNFSLAFTAPGYPTLPFSPIAVFHGSAANLALNAGNGQTAPVNAAVAVPPSVRVTDASGNPVSATVVTFTTTAGATITNASTSGTSLTVSTDSSGIAALTSWTLGSTAGNYTLTASASGLSGSPVTFTATATAGAVSAITFTQAPPSSASSGVAFSPQPSVQLRDSFGNPVARSGVGITANIISGSGGLTNSFATTDATGLATWSGFAVSGSAGSITLQYSAASCCSLTSSPIALGAGAGSALSFTQQPSSSGTSGAALATQPIIQVRDNAGNPVSAASVLIVATISSGSGTLSSGSAVTNASGTATFSGLTINGTAGNFTLQFNGGGFTPVTFGPIAVGAGSAVRIALQAGNNQSVSWGQAVPIPPAVLVTDGSGNPVPGVQVTFTPVTLGGQVQNSSTTSTGPLDVTTNAQGIAALTAFYVGNQAGNYTLTAAASGLSGSPVTFTETAVAGPSTHLAFNTAPSTTGQSGVPLAIQPVVELRDAAGNTVPQAGVVITATFGVGGGTFTNGTATTNAAGLATFSGFAVNSVVGNYTIAFTAPSLTSIDSPLALSAGPAAVLAVAATGSTIVTNDAAFPAAPQVRLRDNSGNNVTQSGVTISAAVTSGNGSVTAGGTATTDTLGIATFAGITITGQAGPYQLTYSSGSLTPLLSGTITVNPGAAASIAPNTGQGQTATVSTTVAVPPSVIVKDISGNGVQGITVNFVTSPAGQQIQNSSTFGPPLDVITDAAGIARLVSWQLGPTAQLDTLTATVPSRVSLQGSPARIIATAVARNANSLAITTQPGSSTPSGQLLAPQPVVQATNGQRLGIANVPVTVFIGAGSSPNATISGTTTVNTDASGFATFTNIRVTGSPGTYSLRFASPGYNQLSIGMSIP